MGPFDEAPLEARKTHKLNHAGQDKTRIENLCTSNNILIIEYLIMFYVKCLII
jgi:hypothetical protein